MKDAAWRDPAPTGKLDLVVDLNFRMDTTALYSDVILPAATWYEKDDLNSTDMHSYIHPLQAAVPPCWESKSDWDIFKAIAEKVSELARTHLPAPVKEIVTRPLMHDTPAEMAQRELRDWSKGECEPEPGKTMPGLAYVERDYVNLHKRFVSYGPVVRAQGLDAHGISWQVDDLYDELVRDRPGPELGGQRYPSLETARDAANVILALAPETNGESAFRAWAAEEKKVGVPLTDLAAGNRNVRTTFADLAAQPRRLLDSPCWTGLTGKGRTYSAYCLNVERLVPWRTLTGRQHFYLDHPGFIAFGEALPTYKPKPTPRRRQGPGGVRERPAQPAAQLPDAARQVGHPLHLRRQPADADPLPRHPSALGERPGRGPHRPRRQRLGRGLQRPRRGGGPLRGERAHPDRALPALPRAGADHRRAPVSPVRGNKRAGGHNSLTRVRLKPTLMLGGYGQFTFALNYWGPTGNNRDTFIRVRKLDGAPQY